MNYKNAFIAVAVDCAVDQGSEPPMRGGKKTIARIQYELLVDNPHELTQEDVLWQTQVLHKSLDGFEASEHARQGFFAKSQACLRASPLAKSYGWGLHFDAQGRTALVPRETQEYQDFQSNRNLEQRVAMASRRSPRN